MLVVLAKSNKSAGSASSGNSSHSGNSGGVHAGSRGLSTVVSGSSASSGLLSHDGVGGELGDLKGNIAVVVGSEVQGLLATVVVLDIDGNLGVGVSLAKGEGRSAGWTQKRYPRRSR